MENLQKLPDSNPGNGKSAQVHLIHLGWVTYMCQ